MERPHRTMVVVLIIVATLIGFLASFAVWGKRQLLETSSCSTTSARMLQSENIRAAVGTFLVDALYTNVDVATEFGKALPPQLKPLAPAIAGGLRSAATDNAGKALARPRVQALWQRASTRTCEGIDAFVKGHEGAVSLNNGSVTLNLSEVVNQVGERTGLNVADKLPPDAGEFTLIKAKQLDFAQKALRVIQPVAIVLTLITLLLYALAVYLATGWRRRALRAVGIGFLVIGLLVLVSRTLVGNAIVGSLTTTPANGPAAHDAWNIATSMLKDIGEAMLFYGVAIILGAWLAGPTRWGTAVRRWLTPYLRERWIAYGGALLVFLLLAWWGPIPATQRFWPSLLLIASLIGGAEALRSVAIKEFPDARRPGTET